MTQISFPSSEPAVSGSQSFVLHFQRGSWTTNPAHFRIEAHRVAFRQDDGTDTCFEVERRFRRTYLSRSGQRICMLKPVRVSGNFLIDLGGDVGSLQIEEERRSQPPCFIRKLCGEVLGWHSSMRFDVSHTREWHPYGDFRELSAVAQGGVHIVGAMPEEAITLALWAGLHDWLNLPTGTWTEKVPPEPKSGGM